MTDLQLHPAGTLHLAPEDQTAPGLPAPLARAFAADWREGLIALAGATAEPEGLSLAARFWRGFARDFLTALCHQPESEEIPDIPPPPAEALAHWTAQAPPMPGGEYLDTAMLQTLWGELNRWTGQALAEQGGLESFLAHRAPAWRRVGRVTFHLAENKQGAAFPFAFLATFTTGVGTGGRDRHLPLHQALKLYAGRGNRAAMVKLLTPVREAARTLDWVGEMVESGAVFQPTAWTAAQAHRFLLGVEDLESAGLVVRIPDWWRQRTRAQVQVKIDQSRSSLLGEASLLEMDVSVMLGDQALTPRELKELMAGPDGLVQIKGRWVEVDRDKLQEVLDHWNTAADEAGSGQLGFHEGLRLLAGAPADLRDGEGPDEKWTRIIAGANLRDVLEKLRDPARATLPRLATGLKGTLRPYQQQGVAWLDLVTGLGLGACLADDMGLGKTLQVLALLTARRRTRGQPPSLLVVPASLLGNWKDEARRFTPRLKLLFLHPSRTGPREMAGYADGTEDLNAFDLVVTTYGMTHRLPWLAERPWHLVILDEAQAIKNSGTRQSRAVRALKATARVALTGTPVENSLDDLWSLFAFLNPGLLGSRKVFKDFIGSLETRGFQPLRQLVAPYILRRMKTDRHIIADLPLKTETVRYCNLTRQQARLYAGVVKDLARGLEQTGDGMARRGLVLQTLLRLKQVCNHPSQLTGDQGYDPAESGKFTRLTEICSELAQRQEKALVFTQYREIIPHLEEFLSGVFGRPGLTLHGGTAVGRRARLTESFQQADGPPFFVISLKAGGTGLNLTQACHVIHFDRWWNPAVENQATDRAFRIGQKQNVLVHKFVTTGTVEEKIDLLIQQKQELATEILSGPEINLTELSDRELLDIVRLDVTGI